MFSFMVILIPEHFKSIPYMHIYIYIYIYVYVYVYMYIYKMTITFFYVNEIMTKIKNVGLGNMYK